MKTIIQLCDNLIVNYIAAKFNVGVEHVAPRPGEITRFPADISFAKSLGYKPAVNIWQGLDCYIKWAKENREMILSNDSKH